MISIIIAEDHHVVRQGLKLLLESERDFRLIGEAADGLEAVRLTEKLKPALLLLDLVLPKLHGLQVARQIKRSGLGTKIVVLSMHGEQSDVVEAMRNGADGYVAKTVHSSDLIKALRKVHSGSRYIWSGVSERLVTVALRNHETVSSDPYEKLSTRERTVLQMTAEGMSNAEIAKRLFISPRTAETHRANLMCKMNLHSQTELVRFAIRRKIITA